MSDVTLQRMRQYARTFPPQGPPSEAAAALVRRMHPLQLVAGPHSPSLTTALSAALAPLESAPAAPAGMFVCPSHAAPLLLILKVPIPLNLPNWSVRMRKKDWYCRARVILARLPWRAHVACVPRLRPFPARCCREVVSAPLANAHANFRRAL